MGHVFFYITLATAGLLSAGVQAATPASKAQVARYAQQLLVDNYAADGPGTAILVARGDEVLYRGARGRADIEEKTPLTADAMFEIGSIIKQFAAAGVKSPAISGHFIPTGGIVPYATCTIRSGLRHCPSNSDSRCFAACRCASLTWPYPRMCSGMLAISAARPTLPLSRVASRSSMVFL